MVLICVFRNENAVSLKVKSQTLFASLTVHCSKHDANILNITYHELCART